MNSGSVSGVDCSCYCLYNSFALFHGRTVLSIPARLSCTYLWKKKTDSTALRLSPAHLRLCGDGGFLPTTDCTVDGSLSLKDAHFSDWMTTILEEMKTF